MTRGFILAVELCALQLFVSMSANVAAATPELLRINGRVSDALGRPVHGASLILQRVDGHIVARAKSQPSGHFEFADIRQGTYAIVANKSGYATATAIVTVTAGGAKPVEISMEAQAALSMQVVAKRLDIARNGLNRETGSSVYRFSEKAIRELPQGTNTSKRSLLSTLF